MDLAIIGTLSSYVKRKNLQFAAKHKIRTGQTLTNANGNLLSMNQTSVFKQMTESAKKSSDAAKQQRIRRIKQKLLAGQKLSDAELGFLREADPKTYKKAKHAEEAREELKAELSRAKSKQEAREAVTRAMVKASSEAMAELTALSNGGGSAVSGGGASNVTQSGANISGDMNVSGDVSGDALSKLNVAGDVSTDVNPSVDATTDSQTLSETNQSIRATGEDATAKVSESTREEISAAHDEQTADNFGNKKSSDADNQTPEDIMENI